MEIYTPPECHLQNISLTDREMATKEYLCKKCKTLHIPHTGRKCQNEMDHSDNMDTIMNMLKHITDQLTVIETNGVVNAEEDPEYDSEIEEAPEVATSKTCSSLLSTHRPRDMVMMMGWYKPTSVLITNCDL